MKYLQKDCENEEIFLKKLKNHSILIFLKENYFQIKGNNKILTSFLVSLEFSFKSEENILNFIEYFFYHTDKKNNCQLSIEIFTNKIILNNLYLNKKMTKLISVFYMKLLNFNKKENIQFLLKVLENWGNKNFIKFSKKNHQKCKILIIFANQ